MERVLGNKVNFSNLVIYSLSILTSCQFTNEPNREISRGVFQNRGVCGQAFPLLPSPSPFQFFFYSRSNFRAITRLETLVTQAIYVRSVVTVIFVITEEDIGRVKIVTLRVGARAKEGNRGGGGEKKICRFLFSLPASYPAPFDSPHSLPSFRVSTCAFASKTFARPKKTPALQASVNTSQNPI